MFALADVAGYSAIWHLSGFLYSMLLWGKRKWRRYDVDYQYFDNEIDSTIEQSDNIAENEIKY